MQINANQFNWLNQKKIKFSFIFHIDNDNKWLLRIKYIINMSKNKRIMRMGLLASECKFFGQSLFSFYLFLSLSPFLHFKGVFFNSQKISLLLLFLLLFLFCFLLVVASWKFTYLLLLCIMYYVLWDHDFAVCSHRWFIG